MFGQNHGYWKVIEGVYISACDPTNDELTCSNTRRT